MTEADCLQYCYSAGYFWLEGSIRLYDILDRVSCWCCCNKTSRSSETSAGISRSIGKS